jgi:hypothetical protein
VTYFEHLKKIFSVLGYFNTAKLSFKICGGIKVFHDKQKLKQYMITKPLLQKILKRILQPEEETRHKGERTVSTKP